MHRFLPSPSFWIWPKNANDITSIHSITTHNLPTHPCVGHIMSKKMQDIAHYIILQNVRISALFWQVGAVPCHQFYPKYLNFIMCTNTVFTHTHTFFTSMSSIIAAILLRVCWARIGKSAQFFHKPFGQSALIMGVSRPGWRTDWKSHRFDIWSHSAVDEDSSFWNTMLLPPSPGSREFTLLELVQSLRMEVASLKTLVSIDQFIHCGIPDDLNLYSHRCLGPAENV